MKNLNTFNEILKVIANTTRYFTVSGKVISLELSTVRDPYIWKLFSIAELLNLTIELTSSQLCMYNCIVDIEVDLTHAGYKKIECINAELLELLNKRKKGTCNSW